jgi:hypothetical protein
LRTPGFFCHVLKPIASILEEIMKELTETFTTIRCRDIDRILNQTTKSRPRNLEKLRAAPVMQDEKVIRKIFKQKKYPAGLFEAIWCPIWNRCHEQEDPAQWWRKGFAYALVFSGPAGGNRGELRIMPGVYAGPGGVVEAEGYIIKRPEDKKFSDEQILSKSENLRDLAKKLQKLHF